MSLFLNKQKYMYLCWEIKQTQSIADMICCNLF